jgi:hypothetical protein
MPRSLQKVVGDPYVDRNKLATIVGQVLGNYLAALGGDTDGQQIVTALVYLEQQGLQHGHLTCSQILLHQSGRVKLGMTILFLLHSFWLTRIPRRAGEL